LHIDRRWNMPVPEQIEHHVYIESPVELVWTVVTKAEHIGAWFGDAAEIDLRPGGAMILTWEKHGSVLGRVEKVDPPSFFSFRWARPAGAEPREGNSTLVEFSLAPEGKGTRLRVVESGFPSLEGDEQSKYAAQNVEGWKLELEDLRRYVAELAGVAR
jgi:uncharacterized protein YndB with AHSA1/START domain